MPAGTELTHEGRYEGYVFVVISGTVKMSDGRTVDTIGPGDFFGEIAAMDGGPRTATVRTIDDARLLTMPHEHFYEVLETSPTLQTAVMAAMEQLAGWMRRALPDLAAEINLGDADLGQPEISARSVNRAVTTSAPISQAATTTSAVFGSSRRPSRRRRRHPRRSCPTSRRPRSRR